MTYVYGMTLRGFAPGCQPMQGLVTWSDTEPGSHLRSILFYDHPLTEEEISAYELLDLGTTDIM